MAARRYETYRALLDQGLTAAEIAEKFGVLPDAIRTCIRYHEILSVREYRDKSTQRYYKKRYRNDPEYRDTMKRRAKEQHDKRKRAKADGTGDSS